ERQGRVFGIDSERSSVDRLGPLRIVQEILVDASDLHQDFALLLGPSRCLAGLCEHLGELLVGAEPTTNLHKTPERYIVLRIAWNEPRKRYEGTAMVPQALIPERGDSPE